MRLRGLLAVLAALLFTSTGSAESPASPTPHRLGRPVLRPPAAEEQQPDAPGGGQQPGGAEQPGSKRLGRPVLTVPPHGARGVPRQDAARPPHRTATPNGSATSEGHPR